MGFGAVLGASLRGRLKYRLVGDGEAGGWGGRLLVACLGGEGILGGRDCEGRSVGRRNLGDW